MKGRRGKNEASYEVDAQTGRPASAKATLRQDFGTTKRGDNATEIGKLGGSGYQGGHLIGHRFMGDTVDGGIAPQVANLNQSAWKAMENEWADWLTKYKPGTGKKVEIDVQVDVDPPGAKVPSKFIVRYTTYEVDGSGKRTKVWSRKETFLNRPGEIFDRVYFRSDGTVK